MQRPAASGDGGTGSGRSSKRRRVQQWCAGGEAWRAARVDLAGGARGPGGRRAGGLAGGALLSVGGV
jgi:hypothetical protein